jgi:hypothetical protein
MTLACIDPVLQEAPSEPVHLPEHLCYKQVAPSGQAIQPEAKNYQLNTTANGWFFQCLCTIKNPLSYRFNV